VEKFYVILDKNLNINKKKVMSRIGKKVIDIPNDVLLTITDDKIIVKGKYGVLEQSLLQLLNFEIVNNKLSITRINDAKKTREYHGLIRALIQNMVLGVTKKFSKTLIAEGVGYKFQIDKKILIVNVGYTHPIQFEIPDDLEIKLESPVKISVIGINKEKVGFLTAKIRDTRPPEPYKGKGLLYDGEIIRRKAGKTGK
jgi:large subunit ribosomal protein L6